jgi:hypothetical protein
MKKFGKSLYSILGALELLVFGLFRAWRTRDGLGFPSYVREALSLYI